MCGRFTSLTPQAELSAIFEAEEVPADGAEMAFRPNYNVAPTTSVLVVARSGDGHRRLGRMTWGLVPGWAKERRGSGHINARAETVAEKPSFRPSIRTKRCLVPMDGYYEWRTVDVAASGPKRAVYVTRRDRRPLAVAGLWSTWTSPDEGVVRRTCCVITTAANPTLARVHDRMPAVIEADDWEAWLGEGHSADAELGPVLELLIPASDDVLTMVDVGPAVNAVRNNGPELIVPL
ncbi:MAG: SOS response-associated peptidase [Actinomycetota bacterium]